MSPAFWAVIAEFSPLLTLQNAQNRCHEVLLRAMIALSLPIISSSLAEVSPDCPTILEAGGVFRLQEAGGVLADQLTPFRHEAHFWGCYQPRWGCYQPSIPKFGMAG